MSGDEAGGAAENGAIVARVAPEAVGEGALVQVQRPPFHVLVTRVNGRLHAIEDACPHSGWSLCEGRLDGHVVTCPGHGWEVDVRTGEVLTAVGRGERNPVFEVRPDGAIVRPKKR